MTSPVSNGNPTTLRSPGTWSSSQTACVAIAAFCLVCLVLVFSAAFRPNYANHLLYSDQFDAAAWVKHSVNIEPDIAESPDGKMTADKIASNSQDGYLAQHFTDLAPGIYDYSVYLRADSDVNFSIFTVSFFDGTVSIDRTNISPTSDWARYNLKGVVFEDRRLSVQIGGDSSFPTENAIYAWGAQLSEVVKETSESPPLISTNDAPTQLADLRFFDVLSRNLNVGLAAFFLFMGLLTLYLFVADHHRSILTSIIREWLPNSTKKTFGYVESIKPNFTRNNFFALFLVCWVFCAQLVITTPLSLIASQPDAYFVSLDYLVTRGLLLSLLFAFAVSIISSLTPNFITQTVQKIILVLAIAIGVEQLILTDLKPFGEFTGQPIEWSEFRVIAIVDFIAIVAVLIGAFFVSRTFTMRKIAQVAVAVFLFSAAPALVFGISNWSSVAAQQRQINDSLNYTPFFEFSNEKNIFYYQPDSVSTDTVKWVFAEYPEVAAEFSGFTFYTDNLTAYNGTLLSTYSIYTGTNANILDDGYGHAEFRRGANENGFPQILNANGFRTEFVPVYEDHCVGDYSLCIERHNYDLTPKALSDLGETDVRKDWLLLLDVSLFRHVPHFHKRHVYNTGRWLLRSRFEPWYAAEIHGIGPVLKEVTENIKIKDSEPRFKWYGGLGGHRPEQYDGNCERLPRAIYSAEAGKYQILCVLREYADFLKELKKAGVYDNTALILNADTGSGIRAWDLESYPDNVQESDNTTGIEPNLSHISMARPALLVKPLNERGALKVSNAQTHQANVPATILEAAGIPSEYERPSVFAIAENEQITRQWFRIHFPIQYGNVEMNFDEYEVKGPTNDWTSYYVVDSYRKEGSDIPLPEKLYPRTNTLRAP